MPWVCNQRTKSIFRCHGWRCLTLAQRHSIHHRNKHKGGQTSTPATGSDINDFCGQPNDKHFIFIYSILAYKNNVSPDNYWLSWSNSHCWSWRTKKKVHALFRLIFSHCSLLLMCWIHSRWNHMEVFRHTSEDITSGINMMQP